MGAASGRKIPPRKLSVSIPQRLGDFLQRRQDIVRLLQWSCAALYLAFLLTAVFMLLPASGAAPFTPLATFATTIFWGLLWPGMILGTLLFGQFWCGLFCPDGLMTEFISRHGRAGKIPLTLRWFGWPLFAFAILMVAGHLLNALRSPTVTLLLLGSGSLAAWATGYFLGRGKRLWCRYLCPAGNLFSLLARGALFHFRVDRAAWDAVPRPLPRPVDCPQLLDVGRLRSNSKCSMCSRCSGHRNAVVLALRWPGAEIATLQEAEVNLHEAFAICFVLIGLGYGVAYGQASVIGNGLSALFGSGLPLRAATVILASSVLGAAVATLLWLGAAGRTRRAGQLAYGLIPLAGIGLFVTALDYAQASAGYFDAVVLNGIRTVLLLSGSAWTLVIGLILVKGLNATPIGRTAAAAGYVLAALLVASCYLLTPLPGQV